MSSQKRSNSAPPSPTSTLTTNTMTSKRKSSMPVRGTNDDTDNEADSCEIRKKAKKFSPEQKFLLIECVERRQCIWNPQNYGFRSVIARQQAFEDVTNELCERTNMEFSRNDVQEEWGKLRYCFNRIMQKNYKKEKQQQLNKNEEYTDSGDGKAPKHSPSFTPESLNSKWTYLPKMHFLWAPAIKHIEELVTGVGSSSLPPDEIEENEKTFMPKDMIEHEEETIAGDGEEDDEEWEPTDSINLDNGMYKDEKDGEENYGNQAGFIGTDSTIRKAKGQLSTTIDKNTSTSQMGQNAEGAVIVKRGRGRPPIRAERLSSSVVHINPILPSRTGLVKRGRKRLISPQCQQVMPSIATANNVKHPRILRSHTMIAHPFNGNGKTATYGSRRRLSMEEDRPDDHQIFINGQSHFQSTSIGPQQLQQQMVADLLLGLAAGANVVTAGKGDEIPPIPQSSTAMKDFVNVVHRQRSSPLEHLVAAAATVEQYQQHQQEDHGGHEAPSGSKKMSGTQETILKLKHEVLLQQKKLQEKAEKFLDMGIQFFTANLP